MVETVGAMTAGKKYPNEVRERFFAMYDICGNVSECARQMGLPQRTLNGWILERPAEDIAKARDDLRSRVRDATERMMLNATEIAASRMANEAYCTSSKGGDPGPAYGKLIVDAFKAQVAAERVFAETANTTNRPNVTFQIVMDGETEADEADEPTEPEAA